MIITALLKLHLSILIAGFTGILGKLICFDSFILGWYRGLITFGVLALIMYFAKSFITIKPKDKIRCLFLGGILALHWICFYGSIKLSNVSIGVICLSCMGFFTSILEPLIIKNKLSIKESLFSLLSLIGILFVFQFESKYRLGIAVGVLGAFLASLYTILNKKMVIKYKADSLLLYEMAGVILLLTLLMPIYFSFNPFSNLEGSVLDFFYVFLLSTLCTIGLYYLQISVMKIISAFTVNLSYNLEPIYSIIIAMILFNEAKDLNFSFYVGLLFIFVSVSLQTLSVIKTNKRK